MGNLSNASSPKITLKAHLRVSSSKYAKARCLVFTVNRKQYNKHHCSVSLYTYLTSSLTCLILLLILCSKNTEPKPFEINVSWTIIIPFIWSSAYKFSAICEKYFKGDRCHKQTVAKHKYAIRKKHSDWMAQVMWLLLTNQGGLLQHSTPSYDMLKFV